MVKPAYAFVLAEQKRIDATRDPKLTARYRLFRRYFESRLPLWGIDVQRD